MLFPQCTVCWRRHSWPRSRHRFHIQDPPCHCCSTAQDMHTAQPHLDRLKLLACCFQVVVQPALSPLHNLQLHGSTPPLAPRIFDLAYNICFDNQDLQHEADRGAWEVVKCSLPQIGNILKLDRGIHAEVQHLQKCTSNCSVTNFASQSLFCESTWRQQDSRPATANQWQQCLESPILLRASAGADENATHPPTHTCVAHLCVRARIIVTKCATVLRMHGNAIRNSWGRSKGA